MCIKIRISSSETIIPQETRLKHVFTKQHWLVYDRPSCCFITYFLYNPFNVIRVYTFSINIIILEPKSPGQEHLCYIMKQLQWKTIKPQQQSQDCLFESEVTHIFPTSSATAVPGRKFSFTMHPSYFWRTSGSAKLEIYETCLLHFVPTTIHVAVTSKFVCLIMTRRPDHIRRTVTVHSNNGCTPTIAWLYMQLLKQRQQFLGKFSKNPMTNCSY